MLDHQDAGWRGSTQVGQKSSPTSPMPMQAQSQWDAGGILTGKSCFEILQKFLQRLMRRNSGCVLDHQEAGWRSSAQVGQAGKAVRCRAGQKLLLSGSAFLLGYPIE